MRRGAAVRTVAAAAAGTALTLGLIAACTRGPRPAPAAPSPAAADTAEARVTEGAARRRRGDLDGADQSLSRALEIDPASKPARLERGLIGLQRFEAAAGYLTPFLQQHGPVTPGANADLVEEAAPWRERALADLRALPVEKLQGDELALAGGAAAFVEGRFEEAYHAFASAGDHAEATAWRARLLLLADRPREARELLDRSLEGAPDDPHAWVARAVCSLAEAETIAQSDPETDAGDAYDDAVAACRRALQRDSKCVHALYTLGVAHHRRGFGGGSEQPYYAPALEAYTKAVEADPQFALTYLARSLLLMHDQKLEHALADLTLFIERKPKASIGYNRRASVHLLRRDPESAVRDYSTAVEHNPRYFYGYVNRGNTYMELEKWGEAAADFGKAVEIVPEYASGFAGRGVCRYRLSRHWEAVKDFERAIELEPAFKPRLAEMLEDARRKSQEN